MGDFIDALPEMYDDIVNEPVNEEAVLRLRKALEIGVLEESPVQ